MRTLLIAAALASACARQQPQSAAPAPLEPRPSPRQLAWHELEYYGFVHFNMNTFTGREWGEGTESPELFQPSALDCRQWARVAKAAGMKGLILTAKHHDGFCLWPSKLTTHDVASSSWRGGRGDVLRELSDALREQGLKFGVYLSPWDRNQPSYGDSAAYNDYFVGQLREVLTNYGEVFEVWWDGACGEGPNGKRQVYDWERFRSVVRELQPGAVMFSDVGPDVRWIGNEHGIAGETCWGMLSPAGFEPGLGAPATAVLNQGEENGTHWIGGECDVSIRPGWYYHAEQDGEVKSLERLLEIWYGSVGRGANLLLNLPVDRRGLVHENDVARLMELRAALDATFAADLARGMAASASSERAPATLFGAAAAVDGDAHSYWAAEDGVRSAKLRVAFAAPQLVDHAVIGEPIALGQRVKRFTLYGLRGNARVELARGTTLGRKRILEFTPTWCDALELSLDDSRATPLISSFEAYCAPPRVELQTRERAFLGALKLSLAANQPGCEIRYTLDGSLPTRESARLAGDPEGELELRASAKLCARAFRGEVAGVLVERAEFRGYTRASLRPATHFLRPLASGLELDLHEGAWQSLVDLPHSKPVRSTLAHAIDLSARPRDEHFALVFRGWLSAPADGVYAFECASDDGARVWLGDELLIDNDGLHGVQTRRGEVGLAAGYHALRIEYFNAAGASALELRWSGPGFASSPLPAAALAH